MFTTQVTSCVYAIKKAPMQMSRKNYSKGEFIKRMMKEQKECFGALLETKKQKMLRLKQEKSDSTKTIENSSNPENSEFSWMMKVSEDRLRRIRVNVEKKTELQNSNEACLNDLGSNFEKRVSLSNANLQFPRVQKTMIRRSSVNPNKLTFTVVDKDYVPVSKLCTRQKIINSTPRGRKDRIWNKFTKKIVLKTLTPNIDLEKSKTDLDNSLVPLGTVPSPTKTQLGTMASKSEMITSKNRTVVVKVTAINPKRKIVTSKANMITVKSKAMPTKPKMVNLEPEKVNLQIGSCTKSNLNVQIQNILDNIQTAELYTESQVADDPRTSSTTMKNLKFLRFPNVMQVLNATMHSNTKYRLKWYREKFIEAFGQEALDEYKQDLLQSNKLFRSSISCELKNLPYEVPQNLELCLRSVRTVLKEVKDVKAIESHIVHKNLGYRGVLDCVASFRGNLCLIKWKNTGTPTKSSNFTCDAPLQIAAYAGALNADNHYPFKIKSGLLVTAYRNGNSPLIQQLDEGTLQVYWKEWLQRLRKYYEQRYT